MEEVPHRTSLATLGSQARERHMNIKCWSGWPWDDPGFVPGTNPCSLSLGQTQLISEEVVGVPLEGHSNLEQVRVS